MLNLLMTSRTVTFIYNTTCVNTILTLALIILKGAILALQINSQKKVIGFLIVLTLKLILCNWKSTASINRSIWLNFVGTTFTFESLVTYEVPVVQ